MKKKICKNPLCIQNCNLVLILNGFFAKNPKETINLEEFMNLQLSVWKEVKKKLHIKTEK